MHYKALSRKQLTTLVWWKVPELNRNDGIICDGSIRSGKTLSMAVGFVLWSMHTFDSQRFAICGKTIEALRRNVVSLLPQWLEGLCEVRERRSDNTLVITGFGHTNTYHEFGGKDESSYTLIQGITLSGVLFDEAALMPRSFVEQALARCSVTGSKFWFNCNPAAPTHWFYQEWIRDPARHSVLYLHFTMEDNLALAPEVRARYERMYSGVFYDRYIQGLWVAADGLVYPMFDPQKHLTEERGGPGTYYISLDYGTVNPTAMGLWRLHNGEAVMEQEYYHDSRKTHRQKTDEEYYQDLEEFAGDTPVQRIIIDPSAASFKECIRRHGKFKVMDADNSVLDGIRFTGTLLSQGRIRIHSSCENTINEFRAYLWDGKSSEDAVVKENDHSMDQMRYFCYTLRRKFRGDPYRPLWM